MIKSKKLRWKGHLFKIEEGRRFLTGIPTGKRPLEKSWLRWKDDIREILKIEVSVIKSRRLRWAGHVARMEEGRSAFKHLTGKSTGKRPLGRPRRRWEYDIRMEFEEIGINTRNWVDSAQDRDYWRVLSEGDIEPSDIVLPSRPRPS